MRRYAYQTRTDHGQVWMLPLDDKIVAFVTDEDIRVHHVPNYGPIGHDDDLGEDLWLTFSDLATDLLNLKVWPLEHPTDTLIAFLSPEHWLKQDDDWRDWGYVWNMDRPEASEWRDLSTATFADSDLYELYGRPSKLVEAASNIESASRVAKLHNPKAVAMAEEFAEDYVWEIPLLISWLAQYQVALQDKVALDAEQLFGSEERT